MNYEELENLLDAAIKAYEKGEPILSDDEYDLKFRELTKGKPDSYLFDLIGTKYANSEKIPILMGSLKTHIGTELDKWLANYPDDEEFILSHKLDGMACLTEYSYGNFTNAWQRGTGTEGANITDKIRHMVARFIEPYIDEKRVYLKGEILLNCEPETLGYKNKRNAVAGIITKGKENLDKLYIVFHSLILPTEGVLPTEEERLQCILGNAKVRYLKTNKQDLLTNATKLFAEETQYDKDGIVICVNKSEPEIKTKYPTHKIALKFNLQRVEATVKEVIWETSRTGKVVPVVHIEPVEIGGVTVSKAAAFNAKTVIANHIGKGTVISLIRAGDVIPYIENTVRNKVFGLNSPYFCPTCNSVLRWDENHVNLICPNPDCQTQKKIAYFLEKLGLEEFGLAKISTLKCKSIVEIFELDYDDIVYREGWGNTNTRDFLNRIEKLKKTTPAKFLAALGIDGLGNTTANLLLKSGFTFDYLLEGSISEEAYLYQELIKVKGIGPTTADNIMDGLEENFDLIQRLFSIGLTFEKKSDTLPLAGKSFCITGTLSEPRKEIERLITANGGENVSAAKCQYLITNDATTGSAKLKKAMEKGTKIISEVEFIKMLKG